MLVIRGRKANLLPASGRSRRLLLHKDLRDRAVATRVKAKVNHSGVGDTSTLLVSQGRELVSIVTNLDTLDRIALRGRDPRVMGHHSPNHQWDMHRRSLFFLTAVLARAWVEVEARTSRLGLQGPRGVSTL